MEETANKIRRILRKLENKAGGIQIGKIYVGVGSKSIRTIDHTVSKVLGAEGEVTSSVLRQLDEECRSYHPAMLDVLEIIPPVYLLDGKNTVLAYCRDKNNSWATELRDGLAAKPRSGEVVSLSRFAPSAKIADVYFPYSDTSAKISVDAPLPEFMRSAVIRISK